MLRLGQKGFKNGSRNSSITFSFARVVHWLVAWTICPSSFIWTTLLTVALLLLKWHLFQGTLKEVDCYWGKKLIDVQRKTDTKVLSDYKNFLEQSRGRKKKAPDLLPKMICDLPFSLSDWNTNTIGHTFNRGKVTDIWAMVRPESRDFLSCNVGWTISKTLNLGAYLSISGRTADI